MMLLWTVQPKSALEEIEKNGSFRCDASQSFNLSKQDSLKAPYDWMILEMQKAIGPAPEGVTYPVWAWHTWEFQHRCPDTDSAAFLKRTEDKILFTLDIPQNEVLLSDFDAWQNVLNDTYVSSAVTKEEWEAQDAWLDSLDDEDFLSAIRDSWHNVFLLDPADTPYLTRGRFIQATFWEIKKEYVLDTRILPARTVK